jgi:hypothetical protein
MTRYRSRLAKTEERRNYRKAFLYILLSFMFVIAFVFYGIPSISKFAAFLTNINDTNKPIEKDDTTRPITPRIDPLPEYTNSDLIEVKGSTEPGVSVIIYYNSSEDEVLANKEGEFLFSFNLRSGKNTISLKSKDKAGNESIKTDTITITHDKNPPDLAITNPPDGSEYYGTKQRQVIIEGNTEENSTVTVNERFVQVDSEGLFTYLTTLNEGDNNFTIVATDKAGNSTESQLLLKYIN